MLEPTPIRRRKRLWALGLGFGTLALSLFLASRGQDEEAPAAVGAAAFMHVLLSSGLLALVYLLGGVGLGAAVMRVMAPGSRQQAWLALAVGPGLALYVSHGLGVLGLLSGPRGQWVAGGTLILGLILFLWMLLAAVRSKPNLPRPPTCSVLWILPAAVTLVAACNPPGWLWGSEAYGYDVLSYHLQLPQEWAKGARLWPLTHNVYSFLPSYVESAYLHFAAVMGGGTSASKPGMPVGLLAYDGVGAMACQLLQAGYGLIAALLVGRAVQTVLARAGLGGRGPGEIGALAGAVMLGTPWVVVVSSMAYNEAAVNALFAGAVLAVLDGGLAAGRKGLIAGVLVGLATGCKPTAAFLVAPTVGVLLLSELPARRWVWAALAGTLGGVLAVAPFLIRNAIATHGNPVFPAGTGWFGPAHWTA